MKTADMFFFNSAHYYEKELPRLTAFQQNDEISGSSDGDKIEQYVKFLSCIVSMIHDGIDDYLSVFDVEISRKEAIAFIREHGRDICFYEGIRPFSEIKKQSDFQGVSCFLPPVALAYLLKKKMSK
ncbi:hypothetical protein [Runella limosa]|uniref:hypothetical protein n=1 Tax=Runella limosa TaxID=370978 RepID=UPI0012F87D66|nr:hypothetical protein [Runella limosa]